MEKNFTPLLEILKGLPDTRKAKGKRHPLYAILALLCLALLCGYKSYSSIAEWGLNYPAHFLRRLGFTHVKPPCAKTFHTVLKTLDLKSLQSKLAHWSEEVMSICSGESPEGIAIDGKTLRGTKKQGADGYHLLSALSQSLGITLEQIAVSAKTNEITGMEELLENLVLQGRIFTMDALLTQRKVAETIIEGGGDYLMIAKDNQPTLKEDIQTVLTGELHFGKAAASCETLEKGHGRVEHRKLTLTAKLLGHINWPGVQQVFQIEREVQRKGKISSEIVYGLTSLAVEEANAERLLQLSRGHWAIENKSHWVRDVTFDEDRSQVRHPVIAQVMATFRNLAIGLIRLSGRERIAESCRYFAANPRQALALLRLQSKTT